MFLVNKTIQGHTIVIYSIVNLDSLRNYQNNVKAKKTYANIIAKNG